MPPALASLRARIRAMERLRPPPAEVLPLSPDLDAVLPGGGLTLGCLHQVVAEDAAATAFCAVLAARLVRLRRRPALWCLTAGDLYAPGLAECGLQPPDLILARARDDTEVLWAMEEGLRCPDLACVVGELRGLDLTAGRRLQLAAEAGGVTGLALHPLLAHAANAGTTRWRVGSASGGRWRLALERCRGGMPGEWTFSRYEEFRQY